MNYPCLDTANVLVVRERRKRLKFKFDKCAAKHTLSNSNKNILLVIVIDR